MVSPDGRNLYAIASNNAAVAVFDRDPATGGLTQKIGNAGCFATVDDECQPGIGLGFPFGIAISSDGESVYVAGSSESAIAVFDRDANDGALTQKTGPAACVAETGGADCGDGNALAAVAAVAVSPDSRHLYAASFVSDAAAAFLRDVPAYDIDGDGESLPLTDGVLLLRFLFGLSGAALTDDAVDRIRCARCTSAEIVAYLEALLAP